MIQNKDSSIKKNVGEILLLGLKKLGVNYFFSNPGSEFVSIIKAFKEISPDLLPEPVLCPHEFQAVSMSYGAYFSTGQPQAVMTHANVGAANALIGLIGAQRMNIPVIFISGQTSQTEKGENAPRDRLIHWAQDSADPGGIFREYVKAHFTLTNANSVMDVLTRAYTIAMTPPLGPVSITVSRDILVSSVDCDSINLRAPEVLQNYSLSGLSLGKIKSLLDSSLKPLIISNRLGKNPNNIPVLRKVAEKHGIGIITPDEYYNTVEVQYLNFLGHSNKKALEEADLVFVIDTDVPWYPLENGPNINAHIVHIGPDPLFDKIPLRSHRVDAVIKTDPLSFLESLNEIQNSNNVSKRKKWIEDLRTQTVDLDKSSDHKDQTLTMESVGMCLSSFTGPDTTLVNELSLPAKSIRVQHGGRYFRSGSASPLGWGIGFALGFGMAQKNGNHISIVAVGDGVFYLSNIGFLQTSCDYAIPLVIVVLNNRELKSISNSVNTFYKTGTRDLPLTKFISPFHFEKCAEAIDSYGVKVTTVSDLKEKLTAAKAYSLKHRRPVIINAIIEE